MTDEQKRRTMPDFEAGGIYKAARRRGILPRRGIRATIAALLSRKKS